MAGCFERAQNGTLLLDEIGEMPIGAQAKLLRVIEEGKVRRLGSTSDIPIAIRVLAATNHSPEKAIQSKLLREDLYYRLNVFHISLPPLRDRKQDLPALAAALIRDLNHKHGCRVTHLNPEVLKRFEAYCWPGNFRELRNVLESAVILTGEGELQLRHLPGTPALEPKRSTVEDQTNDALKLQFGAPMKAVVQQASALQNQRGKSSLRRLAGPSVRIQFRKWKRKEKRRTHSEIRFGQIFPPCLWRIAWQIVRPKIMRSRSAASILRFPS
jgi:transcriptional regulator with PAS, ATPase and Fis domain